METNLKKLFDSEEFCKNYHCDLPMGAFCGCEGTLFRLWTPMAQKVVLYLYDKGHDSLPLEEYLMIPGDQGTWIYKTARNLDGMYYDYELFIGDEVYRTIDPYAKACGVNGKRGMVLAPGAADPQGWAEDRAPKKPSAEVIYELHIGDFSHDSAGGFAPEDQGHFSALCRKGTSLHNEGKWATGSDYLKRLGVTHIQILPMYDYGSVDERNPGSSYNWGYDPVNYNIPEGSYSSDPYDGRVRIRELKEMILQLHKEGFRVIMDVVYNHTYDLHSPLFCTVPWYFYRQWEDGSPANGSGCGNDIATERSMCAKFILDSVLYWAEEYHMDGFRFDLMGLIDTELMNQIGKELDERYGEGEKLIYGEPWRAADTAARENTILSEKGNLKLLRGNIGAFCDDTRDSVKGSVMDEASTGFVNGGEISAERLASCLTAWTGEQNPNQSPAQCITYLSCHDDWTLWDKLVYTMDAEKDFLGRKEEILRANKLAAAIYFCCQGRVFLHAGEEFGRTKGGIKNSYCSPAEVNAIDWKRAYDNRDLVEYYRGLIALRKELPWTRDLSPKAKERLLWVKNISLSCALALVDNEGGGKWSKLLFGFHCGKDALELQLPEGKWQLLVDGASSFCRESESILSRSLLIPPCSAVILGAIEN